MARGFFDRFRAPIMGTLRKDPFDKLIEHAKIVRKCTESMKLATDAYFRGDFEEFEKYRKNVREEEHEADNIKKNIRNHMPGSIHMSVDKSSFLQLVTQQDKILDYEEDVVQWLGMRKKTYPPELTTEFNELTEKVIETINHFEQAVFNIPDVVETSFTDEERDQTKNYIKKVSLAEHESDILEQELSAQLFSMEGTLSAMDIYHLMRVVNLLGEISNHAENASDRIRTLLAR